MDQDVIDQGSGLGDAQRESSLRTVGHISYALHAAGWR
jgi:hypothetical protein